MIQCSLPAFHEFVPFYYLVNLMDCLCPGVGGWVCKAAFTWDTESCFFTICQNNRIDIPICFVIQFSSDELPNTMDVNTLILYWYYW